MYGWGIVAPVFKLGPGGGEPPARYVSVPNVESKLVVSLPGCNLMHM